jgi:hypothetical protein
MCADAARYRAPEVWQRLVERTELRNIIISESINLMGRRMIVTLCFKLFLAHPPCPISLPFLPVCTKLRELTT